MQQVQLAINNISSLSTTFNGGTNLFADNAVLTQYVNQLRGLTAQQVQLALSTKLLTAEQKQQITSELGLVATENTIQSELLQTALAQAGLNAAKQEAILKSLGLQEAESGEILTEKSCTRAALEKNLLYTALLVRKPKIYYLHLDYQKPIPQHLFPLMF